MKLIPILIFIIFFANSANAAIDCKKALSNAEKSICSSEELLKLDKKLNNSFKEAWKGTVLGKIDPTLKSPQAKQSFFYSDQVDWLKNVRDKCKGEACLSQAYQSRIGKLQSWNEIESKESISGSYQFSTKLNPATKTEDNIECLIIKPSTKGLLRFDAIKRDNGYCEAGGKLINKKGVYSYLSDPDHDTDFDHEFSCNLKLYVKKYTIEIESDCENTFTCGMNGSINGLMVPRKSKKSEPSEGELCYTKKI